MFYQAIPGSGKTTLVRRRPDLFVDSDDIMKGVIGEASAAAYHAIMNDDALKRAFVERCLGRHAVGLAVLCNFDPLDLGLPEPVRRFAYAVDDYVPHLRAAGRIDLLQAVPQNELRHWAESYQLKTNVSWLRFGEFIGARFGSDGIWTGAIFR